MPKEGCDTGKQPEKALRDHLGERGRGTWESRVKPGGLLWVKLVPRGWACWAGEFCSAGTEEPRQVVGQESSTTKARERRNLVLGGRMGF